MKVRHDPDNCDYEKLDPSIREAVRVLREYSVETFESCQGGEGHSYAEPTVRFHGQREEGFRAFAAARQRGLKVYALRRVWSIEDGEPVGPYWEMTFSMVQQDEPACAPWGEWSQSGTTGFSNMHGRRGMPETAHVEGTWPAHKCALCAAMST